MSTARESTANSSQDLTVDSQQHKNTAAKTQSTMNKKAVVVGLYGIPGSGKTYLLHELKRKLGLNQFAFYEGSEMIASVVPGGLGEFRKLDEQDKVYWCQQAIQKVGQESIKSGKVAVVTGHLMFWSEEQEEGTFVYTEQDLMTFTHILYLDVPAETVAQRRWDDGKRGRPSASISHLSKWQMEEKTRLRNLCPLHGILFSLVSFQETPLNKLSTLLLNFKSHTEQANLSRAESCLDEALMTGHVKLKRVLFMGADRTLAKEDTGALFWKTISASRGYSDREHTLKTLFSGPLGYSYATFRQAVLLYEEVANDQEVDALCQQVASAVTVYPKLMLLLQSVAAQEHVRAVVVTSGLRLVWKKVLKREELSEKVKVVDGGRIADDLVIMVAVKSALVDQLQQVHQVYVWAFEDSPLDLKMLQKADEAIVMVGDVKSRSKTMDATLTKVIDEEGLQACQVLLSKTTSS